VPEVVVIRLLAEGVNPEMVLRKTSYTTPEVELAFQLIFACVSEALDVARLVGATGAGGTLLPVPISIPLTSGLFAEPAEKLMVIFPVASATA
jgi:hypothetical protein